MCFPTRGIYCRPLINKLTIRTISFKSLSEIFCLCTARRCSKKWQKTASETSTLYAGCPGNSRTRVGKRVGEPRTPRARAFSRSMSPASPRINKHQQMTAYICAPSSFIALPPTASDLASPAISRFHRTGKQFVIRRFDVGATSHLLFYTCVIRAKRKRSEKIVGWTLIDSCSCAGFF